MAKEGKEKTKRTFKSGAYRDNDVEKLQFRRCLSHRVLFSFAEFMRKHNTMPDGTKRNEENWKKGFPQESFMDSKFRHFMDTWKAYEEMLDIKNLIEYLNAELFNTMGWLDLLLRPGMTVDKFRKTVEGIEKLEKPEIIINNKAAIKELDKLAQVLTQEELEKKLIEIMYEYNDIIKPKETTKKIRPDKTSRKAFKITGRRKLICKNCNYIFTPKASIHIEKSNDTIYACPKCGSQNCELKNKKVVHYRPPNRLHSTLCGLMNKNSTIKATGAIQNVTCLTCLKTLNKLHKSKVQ